jgi:hypothetical protein
MSDSRVVEAVAIFKSIPPQKKSIELSGMSAPPIAKIDVRPWRSQIDALLLGIVADPAMRRAMLEAFEQYGFLAYSDLEPEIAVDGFGRLRRTLVNKALETFNESLRMQVISVFEKVNAID